MYRIIERHSIIVDCLLLTIYFSTDRQIVSMFALKPIRVCCMRYYFGCRLTMTGYLPVGFEFAAELTFPESEGTSSGLLNACAQIFGIILTLGMRAMMERVSTLAANITVTVILLIGTVITGDWT